MGILTTRLIATSTYLAELCTHGTPELVGRIENEVLIILDGVGGMQFGPLQMRRCLRQDGRQLPTVLYRWQYGLPGEILTDILWLRRNRMMGLRLARNIRGLQRDHPHITIHLLAFSGGAGVAVFACEKLRRRRAIETLILACPALSPGYNLAPAMEAVNRCYALISRRDFVILGLGTRLLGTTDRRFESAAGRVGFRLPNGLDPHEQSAYARIQELHWSPRYREFGHYGGHTGWMRVSVMRHCIVGLLEHQSALPLSPVATQ